MAENHACWNIPPICYVGALRAFMLELGEALLCTSVGRHKIKQLLSQRSLLRKINKNKLFAGQESPEVSFLIRLSSSFFSLSLRGVIFNSKVLQPPC